MYDAARTQLLGLYQDIGDPDDVAPVADAAAKAKVEIGPVQVQPQMRAQIGPVEVQGQPRPMAQMASAMPAGEPDLAARKGKPMTNEELAKQDRPVEPSEIDPLDIFLGGAGPKLLKMLAKHGGEKAVEKAAPKLIEALVTKLPASEAKTGVMAKDTVSRLADATLQPAAREAKAHHNINEYLAYLMQHGGNDPRRLGAAADAGADFAAPVTQSAGSLEEALGSMIRGIFEGGTKP